MTTLNVLIVEAWIMKVLTVLRQYICEVQLNFNFLINEYQDINK